MTPRIPKDKSRLMLVEGKDDKEFFIQLAINLGVIDNWQLHIEKYGGKNKLGNFLRGLMKHPNFDQIHKIGVVRDADYSGGAFQSVLSHIDFANRENKPPLLPQPRRHLQEAEGNPSMTILLLPSANREGMLEDLIMDVLQKDPVAGCVDSYFDCLSEVEAPVKERLSKARVRAFVTGKNVSSNSDGDDSDRRYLSDVFHMSWWRDEFWNHATFDDAKHFLRQLLAE